MKSSTIFLIGTSRGDGNTWRVLNYANQNLNAPIINLAEKAISYFDYEHKNSTDDFLPTIEEILRYDTIGFVTPIYWYTVSAQMKTFLDRISDLLDFRKDLGRSLRGKNTFLLSTGYGEESLAIGASETIRLTSNYLGMNYKGSYYARVTKDLDVEPLELAHAKDFVESVC